MRYLLVGDSPLIPSGTGRVLKQIAAGLAKRGHTVAHAAAFYDPNPNEYSFPIWLWERGGFGCDETNRSKAMLRRAVDEFKPDTIIMFGDAWYASALYQLKIDTRPNDPRVILYLTIDSGPFPVECHALRVLDGADHIATTTDFGRRMISGDVYPGLQQSKPLHYDATHIPLGVDKAVFTPDGRDDVRANIPDDRAVIAWVGRNQSRKNPVAALEALRHMLSKGLPVTMWMKTEMLGEHNLLVYCDHLGLSATNELEQRLNVDVYVIDKEIDEGQMAVLYKRADVFLSTAAAAAPDLPILEARACGTPAVASHTSSMPEVADYTVAPRGHFSAWPSVCHELADPHGLAEAMELAISQGLGVTDKPIPSHDDTVAGLLSFPTEKALWLDVLTL